MTTQIKENGRNTFQPSLISWSYLYRGTIALTKANKKNNSKIFKINHIAPGINVKGYNSMGDNQPPKNNIAPIAHINKMLAYSPNQNIAYIMPEYSVWYPATNSASASGKSKGGLFVSANAEIKKITNIGNNGITNHTFCWAITMSFKLSEPTHNNTLIIITPIDTS